MRSRLVENNQRIYACNRGDTSKSFASCCARTFQKDAGACEAPSKKRMLDTGSETKKLRPWLLNWIEHGLNYFWRTMCIRRCCNRQHLDSNKYCGTLRNKSRYNPTRTHQTCYSSGATPHLQVQLSFSQAKIAYTCA